MFKIWFLLIYTLTIPLFAIAGFTKNTPPPNISYKLKSLSEGPIAQFSFPASMTPEPEETCIKQAWLLAKIFETGISNASPPQQWLFDKLLTYGTASYYYSPPQETRLSGVWITSNVIDLQPIISLSISFNFEGFDGKRYLLFLSTHVNPENRDDVDKMQERISFLSIANASCAYGYTSQSNSLKSRNLPPSFFNAFPQSMPPTSSRPQAELHTGQYAGQQIVAHHSQTLPPVNPYPTVIRNTYHIFAPHQGGLIISFTVNEDEGYIEYTDCRTINNSRKLTINRNLLLVPALTPQADQTPIEEIKQIFPPDDQQRLFYTLTALECIFPTPGDISSYSFGSERTFYETGDNFHTFRLGSQKKPTAQDQEKFTEVYHFKLQDLDFYQVLNSREELTWFGETQCTLHTSNPKTSSLNIPFWLSDGTVINIVTCPEGLPAFIPR